MSSCVVFSVSDLLPEAWRPLAKTGPIRMFNPGLLRTDDGWILAYRVVAEEGTRRIALCRLDRALAVVPGSPEAFSDAVRFGPGEIPERARTWLADPRLYHFGGKGFIYWNSGWHDPRNYQFLQELDLRTLQPVGPARELQVRGERRPLEKNWVLFEEQGVHAVYSVNPLRILSCPLGGSGAIVCTEETALPWADGGYSGRWGELRGGTPPQRQGDAFYAFGHSVHPTEGGYDYSPLVYRFAATPPFAPIGAPVAPLVLPNPFGRTRLYPKLNPAVNEVLYPCGASWDDGRWLVSYGINDEHCAVAVLSPDEVEAALRPVVRSAE